MPSSDYIKKKNCISLIPEFLKNGTFLLSCLDLQEGFLNILNTPVPERVFFFLMIFAELTTL